MDRRRCRKCRFARDYGDVVPGGDETIDDRLRRHLADDAPPVDVIEQARSAFATIGAATRRLRRQADRDRLGGRWISFGDGTVRVEVVVAAGSPPVQVSVRGDACVVRSVSVRTAPDATVHVSADGDGAFYTTIDRSPIALVLEVDTDDGRAACATDWFSI